MKRFAIGLCFSLLLPALLAAQAGAAPGQKLILEFVDGAELTVTTANQAVLKYNAGIFEGDAIPVGATVATGPGTSAELRIKPNGSILKLSRGSVFKVSSLGTAAKDKNAFTLASGKVRAVAAKGGNYELRSQTAVCGVRGTDFSFGVEEGSKAILMVSDGLVQFDKLDASGAVLGSLPIGAGQAADAFAASFAAFAFDMGAYAEEFGDMAFARLLESDVPPEARGAEPQAQPQQDLSPKEAAEALEPDQAAVESGLAKWIREALGMEIGSVTINGATYSKAVIQPNMRFGKVKLGLYLPIIYTSDLFDPDDWYRPGGNDEWSFGSEGFGDGDYADGAADLARDLALKIKYFEYGEQMVDPFFLKVGNLSNLTLGHGLIMRNYANDTEFPAVRRVGFNVGLDREGGGFEAIVNDLAAPEIFGLRGFFRPISGFKLALGGSLVADIAPAANLEDGVREGLGDPMLLGAGIDLDLPVIASDALSLRLFADGAVTLPYLREDMAGADAGLQYELVYDEDAGELRNWGASAGVMGKFLFMSYRLEYRYFTGLFRPSFFDATYDRNRSAYAMEYAYLAANPDSGDDLPNIMGVYGEGGFSFMKDKLGFSFGYMLPWAPGESFSEVNGSDEFRASFYIRKGLIPIFDAAGSVSYERRGLAKALADGDFSLLDENSFFGGEILIPVPKTPTLDLAIMFKTVPVYLYDLDGNVTNIDSPEIKPSVSIETRFHL